ncbi:unnamed protein product, partial [Mesorhabditis spiculigera]
MLLLLLLPLLDFCAASSKIVTPDLSHFSYYTPVNRNLMAHLEDPAFFSQFDQVKAFRDFDPVAIHKISPLRKKRDVSLDEIEKMLHDQKISPDSAKHLAAMMRRDEPLPSSEGDDSSDDELLRLLAEYSEMRKRLQDIERNIDLTQNTPSWGSKTTAQPEEELALLLEGKSIPSPPTDSQLLDAMNPASGSDVGDLVPMSSPSTDATTDQPVEATTPLLETMVGFRGGDAVTTTTTTTQRPTTRRTRGHRNRPEPVPTIQDYIPIVMGPKGPIVLPHYNVETSTNGLVNTEPIDFESEAWKKELDERVRRRMNEIYGSKSTTEKPAQKKEDELEYYEEEEEATTTEAPKKKNTKHHKPAEISSPKKVYEYVSVNGAPPVLRSIHSPGFQTPQYSPLVFSGPQTRYPMLSQLPYDRYAAPIRPQGIPAFYYPMKKKA